MRKTVREYAEELLPEMTALRREIHAHPDVGMDCTLTANRVCRELEKIGVNYRRCGDWGVMAEIKGTLRESKAVVMLRADMDGLTVAEKTGLPFASEDPSRMHACGHDLHTSMLLGSVKVLHQLRDTFAGTVRFLFQPGEETGKGAGYMIGYGAMEGVDMGLGVHVDPLSPVGVLKCKTGPDWAAVDHFYIRVHGTGAHGAMPHTGADAVVATALIAANMQSVVSRECSPMKPLVITIGKMTSGTAFNIIAQDGYLEGTCRCFDDDVWEQIPEAMTRFAASTARALKCTAEVEIDRICRPLINSVEAYDMLKNAAFKVLDDPDHFKEALPETIGEDFAEYTKYAPCVFAHLGTDGGYPLHNSYVNFREEAMPYGTAVEVQFALDALAHFSQFK